MYPLKELLDNWRLPDYIIIICIEDAVINRASEHWSRLPLIPLSVLYEYKLPLAYLWSVTLPAEARWSNDITHIHLTIWATYICTKILYVTIKLMMKWVLTHTVLQLQEELSTYFSHLFLEVICLCINFINILHIILAYLLGSPGRSACIQLKWDLLYKLPMIQVTSSLVVTSDKINACSVYTQQAYLRVARVSMAPRPRDQLNAKDANVTSLQNWYWLGSYIIM